MFAGRLRHEELDRHDIELLGAGSRWEKPRVNEFAQPLAVKIEGD
jgi:hypothetical protein